MSLERERHRLMAILKRDPGNEDARRAFRKLSTRCDPAIIRLAEAIKRINKLGVLLPNYRMAWLVRQIEEQMKQFQRDVTKQSQAVISAFEEVSQNLMDTGGDFKKALETLNQYTDTEKQKKNAGRTPQPHRGRFHPKNVARG